MNVPHRSARRIGRRVRRASARPMLERMERRELLATFSVTSNADSGAGTLRQAILDANGSPGNNTINFDLPSTELKIAPTSAPLPALSNTGTTIDATTQTGYSATNGRPVVILDGSLLPSTSQGPGLDVTGGGCTIKGLVIENFVGHSGITLSAGPDNLVQDCYIGTSANGLAAAPNGTDGINVQSDGNTIGGAGVDQRNVISGNVGNGINITGNQTTVQGDYIGLGPDGKTIVANANGIETFSSVGNQIGGTATGSGNVISGNGSVGINIFLGNSTGDTILGNLIGTDATGAVVEANAFDGILIQAAGGITIGGVGAAGNVISGNGGSGIDLLGSQTQNVTILGNRIGVAATGTAALPNQQFGILVQNSINDVIGGSSGSAGNVIAYNGGSAAYAGVADEFGSGIEILSNSIHDNGGGGISMSTGSNAGIQPPTITSAVSASGVTEVVGSFAASAATGANDQFTVQFFDNKAADAGGLVEGQTLIGQTTVTTDVNGNGTFDVRLPVGTTVGDLLTATLTQSFVQNTSQFSTAATVGLAPTTHLQVAVSPSANPLPLGGQETYTVTVTNTGAIADTNVVLTGTPDANSTYVSSTASQGKSSFTNGLLTADLGTLQAGASATITFVATPNAVGTIGLTAAVTGDVIDSNPSSNTVTSTVTVNPSADVSVQIAASPNPVALGTQLAYNLTVTNNGPSTADNVVVTDTLPAGVTIANIQQSQGEPYILSTSGDVVTIPLDSMSANGSATITIDVTPNQAGSIVDTASVVATESDPNTQNNSASSTTVVENASDLAVAVTPSAAVATAGQPLTYTVAVTNDGPSAATAPILTDLLPAGVAYVSATAGQGKVSEANGTVTADLGTIAAGKTATVTIAIKPPSSGSYTNTATVADANEIDTNTANNTATTTVLASPVDLAVSVVANPTVATAGSPLTYVVTVRNVGPATAVGAVAIDQLAPGVVLKSVATSQGTDSVSGGRATLQLGDIPSGGAVTIVVDAVPPYSGPINDIAAAASLSYDPNKSNNIQTITTLVSPSQLVVHGVASTATPTVGDPMVYGFTVTNAGPTPARDAGINVTLPAGVAYSSASTTVGFTGLGGDVLSAAFGTLPVGATATVFVTVVPTAIGAIQATAAASSANYEPDPSLTTATVAATAANYPGVFNLSSSRYVVNENGGAVAITIDRTVGTLGAVDVSYTTAAGTAVPGTNFTTETGTVRFNAGETSKTILVPVRQDGVITPNLTFYFAITGADNGGTLGATAAAAITEVNVDRDTVPPEVVAVTPVDVNNVIAGYVVDFSKPLDPASAANPANYGLFASGRDGGGANTPIPVAAYYNASNDSVTLVPPTPLRTDAFYGLIIAGAGITDLSGNMLDGNGAGQAGSNYGAYLGMGSNLAYVDSGGNLVDLTTPGATMLMVRDFAGDPYEIDLMGVVPGAARLDGTIHRFGSSTGFTTIGEVNGFGAFGSVQSGLTTPPFYVAASNFNPSMPVPQSVALAQSIGMAVPSGPRYVAARLAAGY